VIEELRGDFQHFVKRVGWLASSLRLGGRSRKRRRDLALLGSHRCRRASAEPNMTWMQMAASDTTIKRSLWALRGSWHRRVEPVTHKMCPDSAPAPGVSAAAVLQADRTTPSALSSSCVTSLAVSGRSSSSVGCFGR
jgi:hypothetical protein